MAFSSGFFNSKGLDRTYTAEDFTSYLSTYNIVLGTDGTSLYLPAELHVGAAKMSVFGYDTDSDTTVRATTVPVTLNIRPSGFVGDDEPPIPPTPDLYAQLLKKIEEAAGLSDHRIYRPSPLNRRTCINYTRSVKP